MGFEKDVPKTGFFQIFDWTAKSRKKLFSNKSDLPENSKQGKRSGGLCLIGDEDNENGIGASFRGSSDFSCGSSIMDEEGYGSRTPSVVARLMGLDSLPNSAASQDPYFDTQSIGHNACSSSSSSRTMIKKFRTEVLPPRSARSIPFTHHRLYSPIKSPGFVPSLDAARVMEAAAAKIIIEPGRDHNKTPLSGSSSAPMKVQALREKAHATQRGKPVESNAAECLKGQSMSSGKSISLAIQAKVNVQRREGLSSAHERRQSDDVKSTPKTTTSFRSQQSTRKSTPSGVLRQNNRKQNNVSDSKPLISNAQSRKLLSSGRQKASKTGPRKLDPTMTTEKKKKKKEAPYSISNSFSRRKRSMEKSPIDEKTWGTRNQKAVKASEERRRKGMDVVSFTFTAPLTRSSSMGGDALSLLLEEWSDPCSSSSQNSRVCFFEAEKVCSPRHLSPVSILEPSFSVESCESTADSIIAQGNAVPPPQAQETDVESKKFCPLEADTELSDSASSLYNHHHPKASITTGFEWELEYVREILFDLDTMFEDFASGRSLDMLNPYFFDVLESRKRPNMERNGMRRRRELFDCVSECLDLRFKPCVDGGFEMWAKGSSMVTKRERLAEEIYREIVLDRERDLMVDELVENDMTGQFGKWLDFEAEVGELGVRLDDLIFSSLIDELVADVFAF